jgi:hypothetical protein
LVERSAEPFMASRPEATAVRFRRFPVASTSVVILPVASATDVDARNDAYLAGVRITTIADGNDEEEIGPVPTPLVKLKVNGMVLAVAVA